MAGLLENIMQGYVNKVNSSMSRGGGKNDALAAQQSADAYQRLQDAISQDYDQQKQQAQASGQEWKMPSPTERMQDQVQAMILSGDPNLQDRGLALLDVPKENDQTNLEKTAALLGLTPMQVFQMQHPGPARTSVNVNLPKQDQPMTFEDAQKLDWSQVPGGYQPGMSMMDAGRAGARLAATKEQAEAASTAATTDESLKGMKESSPNTTQGAIPGTVADIRSRPDMLGTITNTALNAAGIPQKPADVNFNARRSIAASNITRALSGTAASDADVARASAMLPTISDDPQTREIKFRAADEMVKNIVASAKNKGGNMPARASVAPGVPSAPRAPNAPKAAPQTRTTKSGLTYTVEK